MVFHNNAVGVVCCEADPLPCGPASFSDSLQSGGNAVSSGRASTVSTSHEGGLPESGAAAH